MPARPAPRPRSAGRHRRALAWLVTAVLGCAGLAACTEADEPVVAFLLASDQADRWTTIDEPAFRARVRETCRGCTYVVRNAGQDPDLQARQFDRALEEGADVVVLNPVDSGQAEELVARAGGVPVVAYDRFVPGADWFVSVDPAAIGDAIGSAVAQAVPRGGRALVINGGRGDANAAAIATAVRSHLDRAGIEVVAEHDPADWSAEAAEEWVAAQLPEAGRLDAVVAANDNQAAGAVAALSAADVSPWPVVTGQDAQLDALQRIVAGEQAITVFKPMRAQAEQAADIAVRVLAGEEVTGGEPYEGVPAFLFEPVAVDIHNMTSVVVRRGAWRLDEICDGPVRQRCRALGLV